MNFSKFWAMQASETQLDQRLREMAQAAWDSALCAVQDTQFGPDGQLRPAAEISASLSRLHTWNTRAERHP